MSNIKPNSVISLLDCPDHIQAVLDASIWASKRLQAPIGLLHSVPNTHRRSAIDYSGCLKGSDDSHMLTQFVAEEQQSNGKLREQARLLLKQSGSYCEQSGRDPQHTYALHRHDTITQSLNYVDDVAQLVVVGHNLTCKSSLPQVVREAECPILVTPEHFKKPKTALFAFDNSPTCHALLDWLTHSSLVRHTTIHVVMVAKETEKNKEAVREVYAKLKQAGITCKKALIDSRDVTASLLYYQQQNEIDMLITGAFGESRLHELLHGSDTQKLLDASKTPYLLYPKA